MARIGKRQIAKMTNRQIERWFKKNLGITTSVKKSVSKERRKPRMY